MLDIVDCKELKEDVAGTTLLDESTLTQSSSESTIVTVMNSVRLPNHLGTFALREYSITLLLSQV